MLFLNNRYYDPTLGQFISVDPLVTITGQPYTYGNANPITYSDPTGLDPDTSARDRRLAEDAGGCTYSSSRWGCDSRTDPFAPDRLPYNPDRHGPKDGSEARAIAGLIGLTRLTLLTGSVACGGPACVGAVGGADGWLAGTAEGEYGVGARELVEGGAAAATWKLSELLGGWFGRFGSSAGPRVWQASNADEAAAANALERAFPGSVRGTNLNVTASTPGGFREIDIVLDGVYVQVKGGAARRLATQVADSLDTTGIPTVGYGPGMPNRAWEAAARNGVPIARDLDELAAMVRELAG